MFRPAFSATLTGGNVEVVVAADAAPAVWWAAEEMTNLLSGVLGAPIPVRQSPGASGVSIFLGDSEWARAAGIDVSSLVCDAFVIKTDGNRLYIAGRDDPTKDPRMLVLVGGDIRPHVIDALQALVGEIKSKCVTETEVC